MKNKESTDTSIPSLGQAKIPSPKKDRINGPRGTSFVSDNERVSVDVNVAHIKQMIQAGMELPAFEMAGPREKIYFDPSKLRCALVTCGGLCPGLNDIIRAVVLELYYGYGVRNIYGIQHGLQGLIPKYGYELL
ncbi:MAG: ATP-dependent 6-phosphofructokinase, partial [bacterium]|nr:ATP-dependent 6-phosphofructokinase [bacterium]